MFEQVVESAVGVELAELPPGAELSRLIADTDRRVLSGHDLVELIAAYERTSSWARGTSSRRPGVRRAGPGCGAAGPAGAGGLAAGGSGERGSDL